MKKMKRVLSFLMALCLLLGDIAVPALAAEATESVLETVQEEMAAAEAPSAESTGATEASEGDTASEPEPETETDLTLGNFARDVENLWHYIYEVSGEGPVEYSLSGAEGMTLMFGTETIGTVDTDPYVFTVEAPGVIELFWPEGTEQNPIDLPFKSFAQDADNSVRYTYEVTAVGETYYTLTGASGMELTAGGKTVLVEGESHTFSVTGPCTIALAWPAGSEQNRIVLSLESFVQDAENPARYTYEVTAAGEIYYVLNGAAGMELTAGEETVLVEGKSKKFSVTGPCTIELAWPAGTAQNPIVLPFESFVQDTENPVCYTYDVTTEGETYYTLTGAEGMKLTVGEETVLVGSEPYTFCVTDPCTIELVWPEGSEQNPIVLPFESFVQDAENPALYTYTVMAPDDIQYHFTLTGAAGMELTAGGETVLVKDESYTFCVTAPCTIELAWPEGTEQNPAELSVESFVQDAGNPARYVYEEAAEGTVYYTLTGATGMELTVNGETVEVDADPFLFDTKGPGTIVLFWPEGSEKNPLVVEVAQGKAVVLTLKDPQTGMVVAPNLAVWDVAPEDRAAATVSKGKVTAKGPAGRTAVVTATLNGETIFYEIRITVPASRLAIIDDRFSTAEKDFEVNGMTGAIDLEGPEGEGTAKWVLTAKLYGKDKTCNGVSQKLVWTSSNTLHATVDNGVVTLLDAGAGKTVTITATAADGSGAKASIKIKIFRDVMKIQFDQNAPKEVATGKSLKLASSIQIVPGNATNKKVDWWLVDGGVTVKKIPGVASISAAGVLAADKNAANGTVVTVRCTAKDDSGVFGDYSVTIRPATTAVQLFKAGSEADISGKTVYEYLKNGQDKTITLTASNLPAGAAAGWNWTCSDKNITVVDGKLTIPASRAGKTISVTATAQDGTNKKGTVKLQIVQPVEALTLPAQEEVAGGKSVKLAANLGILPENATNKKMDWWLVDSSGALVKQIRGVASITSAGVFAADKAAAEETTVTVKCVPKDEYVDENGKDASVTCKVTIKPITTAVTLDWQEAPAAGVFVMNVTDTLVIEAESKPLDAKQDWRWTTSVADAVVAQTGAKQFAVTFGPKCVGKTVTITAIATDGSNKKESLKIKVVQPVESLSWSGPVDAAGNPIIIVGQGKSQNLTKLVQIDQLNASNKKLDWTLYEKDGKTHFSAIAASVRNGAVKASFITKVTEARLTVRPMDGYEDAKGNPVCEPLTIKVMLYPKTAVRVAIIDDRFSTATQDFEVNGMTGQIEVVRKANGGTGTALWELKSKVYPYDTDPDKSACQQLQWTSSNENWAVVDNEGNITLLEAGIGKTVTITAAAVDGSGKKAAVKIKILEGRLPD